MTAQITGLAQAQRNANDGISLAQTAEGSLNQVNDNLQRIRELTVQASNSTNSGDDLQSIQDEINQRLSEIDRISGETNFNGTKVLAEDQALVIQVGANDGETIKVNLSEITASTLGMSQLNVTEMVFSENLSDAKVNVVEGIDPEWSQFTIDTTGGNPFEAVVGNDNNLYVRQQDADSNNVYFDATFDPATGAISVGAVAAGVDDTNINADATEFNTSGGVVSTDLVDNDNIDAPNVNITTVYMTNDAGGEATQYYVQDAEGNFYGATLDYESGELSVDLSTIQNNAAGLVTENTISQEGTAVSAQNVLDAIATEAVEADFTAVDAGLGGTNTLHTNGEGGEYLIRNEDADGKVTFYAADVDQDTGEIALQTNSDGDSLQVVVDPLASIDDALSQIDSLRSDLGAIQNRFEDAITNLNTNETNLSAARSRIEDADYAVEVANMTRAQILQQAGTSVLAQANQIPQNVLSLLG